MTCAACATRIGRGLSQLDGVEQAAVNLAAARATIVFDPAAVGEAEFRTTIEGLGYGVAAAGTDPELEHLAVIRRRLLVAVALTIPTLAISMLPPLQFDGWHWVVGLLATPVVL
jgi:Cu+-exporting ATPase